MVFISEHHRPSATRRLVRRGSLIRQLRMEAGRVSNEQFRATWEEAVDAMALSDPEGTVLFANPDYFELYGYSAEEVIGHNFSIVFPEEMRSHAIEMYRAIFADAQLPPVLEVSVRCRDGLTRIVEAHASFITQDGKPTAMMSLLRDITERKHLEEERLGREAAERANRAKSEFLARMNHELRTPLNAILGFAQLLDMDELLPVQHESIGHITQAGKHLLDLINEVMDISRIEEGKLPISVEPVPLQDVLVESLQLMRPMFIRENIRINVDAGTAEGRYVMADAQRLKQVLLNLLSNAIQYNRPGGEATLVCEKTGGSQVRLTVSDTGYGIAPEDIEKLFIPFERLNAAQQGVEGTGLGLALCKRLVELMGGSIGVDSTVGSGTSFWIDLVLAAHAIESIESPGNPHSATPILQSKEYSVLYIEDNLSNLKLVERIIAHHSSGKKLLSAMQGRIGLQLARDHQPDVILLDLQLPDMAGEEVLRQLQDTPETNSIPVVVLSADATPRQIEKFLSEGATAYLTKPIDIKQFLDVLGSILPTHD